MSDRIGTVRAVSFSPTGSTRRVLRSIAAGIGAARVQEDSLDRPAWREAGVQVGADELLLVGMPVYAGRVPGLFHGGLPVRGTAMPSAWSATATGRMKTRYRNWSG